MTTTAGNPFASPATQTQPSISDQYPVAGADIMQNQFTGPRAALSAYRNGTARGGSLAKPMLAGRGGKDTPMRNPPGGTVPNLGAADSSMGAPPPMNTGAIASGPQTMQAGDGGAAGALGAQAGAMPRTGPQRGLQGYLAGLAGSGASAMGGGTFAGTNALGLGPGRVQAPGVMRPNRTGY